MAGETIGDNLTAKWPPFKWLGSAIKAVLQALPASISVTSHVAVGASPAASGGVRLGDAFVEGDKGYVVGKVAGDQDYRLIGVNGDDGWIEIDPDNFGARFGSDNGGTRVTIYNGAVQINAGDGSAGIGAGGILSYVPSAQSEQYQNSPVTHTLSYFPLGDTSHLVTASLDWAVDAVNTSKWHWLLKVDGAEHITIDQSGRMALPQLPTVDPEIVGKLYEDPITHAVTVSQGAP